MQQDILTVEVLNTSSTFVWTSG